MHRPGLRIFVSSIAAAGFLSGCGEPTGPSNPGIHIIRATLSDTIETTHGLQLVVRDSTGHSPANVAVRFETPFVVDSNFPYSSQYRVLVLKQGDSLFRAIALDTTDFSGRLSVTTRFSWTAGPAELIISVPTLEYIDTVHVTILPGNPTGVTVVPADTALYTARQFQLRAWGIDRYRNARPEVPVEYSVLNGPVSVTPTGSVTTAAIGRASIQARALGRTDTSHISVVPQAWVATQKFITGNGGPAGIFLMQLDGSGRDSLTAGLINSFTPHGFGWSPDGRQLVLTRDKTVYLLEPGGLEQPLVTMTDLVNTAARFSPDGQWVYFALAYGSQTQSPGLYRIKSDGTGLEHLGQNFPEYFASPSHDGQSVAYASFRTPCGVETCIRVLDLATTQDRVYGTRDYLARGDIAAWSPAEDLIAYGSGYNLNLIRSDGTAVRSLASDAGHIKWMDWSPDGRWLIVAADFGVALFDVQSGVRLPLAHLLSHSATVWRP